MFKKLLVLITAFSVFAFPSQALAKVIIQEQGSVVIPATETIDDDLFVAAESLSIDGTITGDVFVGAGTVRISGDIKGGLFVGTGDLILTGATVRNSVVAGAGNVTIDSTSQIGGSLVTGTGNLKNYAPVGRNVMVGAGTIYLDSKVGKEARLGGGVIDLGPNSRIGGNLTYALGEDSATLTQSPTSTVAGTISRFTPPSDARRDMDKAKEDFGKFGLIAHRGWLTISFLASLLIGSLLLRLFPKTGLGLSQTVEGSLMRSLGIGFLIFILFVPVMLVLALTVIGLPIVGLLIPAFAISLTIAKLVSSYALGRFAARQFNWNKMGIYATYLVGLAVFYLLRSLPGISWLAYRRRPRRYLGLHLSPPRLEGSPQKRLIWCKISSISCRVV